MREEVKEQYAKALERSLEEIRSNWMDFLCGDQKIMRAEITINIEPGVVLTVNWKKEVYPKPCAMVIPREGK